MNEVQKKLLVHGDVIIVGIDVAKHNHWARIYNQIELDVVKPFKFHNSKEGYYRLVAKMEEAKEKARATKVVIGMEPTGHYWKPLAWFLQEQGYTVVIVNPYHVKRRKEEVGNSPTKNDRKDAGIIAKIVKDGNFLHCLLPKGKYAELRNLTVTRRQQRRKLNSALNQLQAILDEYFPELGQVFKNLLGKAAQWVLRNCPFPSLILAHKVEELAEQLKEASNHRVGMKRAQALYQTAQESIAVTEGLTGARHKLNACLDEIAFYQQQIEQTEAAMAEILAGIDIAGNLLSIPGIGLVTIAGFLGEIGDPQNYEHWKQIQKLAGLNLSEQSSGKKDGQSKISKRGRAELRNLLYQASLTLVAKNREIKALYHYFLTRRENPLKKKQALIAIAVKLLRVMYGLARKKENYDPDKVLGDYRRAQLQQAA
ncbi:MAG: transposase [Moorella sp. (in: firmicutes)]|jgi:transposase|nr:transposase [Moorella sp. (in: firmicutes)]